MKKKFKAFLAFLNIYKKENISFSWPYNAGYDNSPDWEWPSTSIDNIPQNIKFIADEIAEQYWEKPFEESPYSESEYYNIFLNVFPSEGVVKIGVEYEVFTDQYETYSNDINAGEIFEFLQKNKINNIFAEYNGDNDSGEIYSVKIDGAPIPDYMGSISEQSYKVVWDFLYEKLEIAFAGWEIDDGSSGEILIFKPYDEEYVLDISHTWKIREMLTSDYETEITENDFDE